MDLHTHKSVVSVFFRNINIFIFYAQQSCKFEKKMLNLFVSSSGSSSSSSWPRLSFKGRRSQEGLNLNSLDVGVFGAPKYN